MEYAIGIDLGGTNLKSALIGKDGSVNNLLYRPAEAKVGPDQVLKNILASIQDQMEAARGEIIGIGIGSPGQINFVDGTVNNPPNFPGWKSVDLKAAVTDKFALPAFVDNDANVAALGESLYGAGKNSQFFALITLGTGVGCGLILEDQLYHGALGAAGEFGHTVINFEGPVCLCGQKGCIERYIGAQWIVERAVQFLPLYPNSKLHELKGSESITPKIISEHAYQGDHLCRRVLEETGEYLGVALGSLVNLLNLDLILIGGGIANAGEILFSAVRRSFKKFSLNINGTKVKIEKAGLGEKAGVIGAGAMVFTNLARKE